MRANPIDLVNTQLQEHPLARFLLFTGLALIIWIFAHKGFQNALIYIVFIYALFHASRGAGAWKQPAGIAFIVAFAWLVLSIPFSRNPNLSVRDLVRTLEIFCAVFAIPVIFNSKEKIAYALLYSAIAITLTLFYDIGRMAWLLGPDLMVKAHAFEPFIMNHSNVASMMAGASCLVFFYFFWTFRRRLWPAFGCAIGIIIGLAYQVIVASRGPQIAFACMLVFMGLLIPSWKLKLIFLAAVVIVGVTVLFNLEHINKRFQDKVSMTTFTERTHVWKHTWELTKDRPVFGYGYGKKNFTEIYYSTEPPESRFYYPHAHQFWLKLLFEFGWTGLILNFIAWLLLAIQLLRCILAETTFSDRLLPGTVALLLLFTHVYGMGDYPDNLVQTAQFWLIPVALVLTRKQSVIAPDVKCGPPVQ